jgi:MarR family transcriptional regulator, organic hydroperoxide resistance regulator
MTVPLDRMICFALYGASQAMQQTYKPLLDPLGLTYPQFLVLSALWDEDGRTVGELCGALGLETSTVTPMVKRMVAAGHVTRARDDEDERRVFVWLTEAGRALQARTTGIAGCVAQATGLPLDDLSRLTDALHRLEDQLRASRETAQRAASATAGSGSSTSA